MRAQLWPVLLAAILIGAAGLGTTAIIAQPGRGTGSNETVEQFVKKLMVFDKSEDGKLTKAELVDRRLHALFDRADTKKNGYVTRADLEALFEREKLSGGGFGRGFGVDKKGKGGFRRGKQGRGGFRPGLTVIVLPVMKALDANGDGEISADELKNAYDALKKLDKNKDGKLSADELRPDFGGFRRGRPGRPGGAEGRPPRPGRTPRAKE